jgi:hypothetical protein
MDIEIFKPRGPVRRERKFHPSAGCPPQPVIGEGFDRTRTGVVDGSAYLRARHLLFAPGKSPGELPHEPISGEPQPTSYRGKEPLLVVVSGRPIGGDCVGIVTQGAEIAFQPEDNAR